MNQQTLDPQLCERALESLIKLFKTATFYPGGHPALKAAITRSRESFAPLVQGAPLVLEVQKKQILWGGVPIGAKSEPMAQLATGFFARKVQKITFASELSGRDLFFFVKCLTYDPASLHRKGGLESLMNEGQIGTIGINAIDADQLRLRRERWEAQAEERRRAAAAADEGAEPVPVQGEAEDVDAAAALLDQLMAFDEAEEITQKRPLQEIYDELRAADDPAIFRKLLSELREPFQKALEQDNFWLAVLVADYLAGVAELDEDPCRGDARKAIRQMGEGKFRHQLLVQLKDVATERDRVEHLVRVLAAIGLAAAEEVMQALADEGEATIRRRLTEVLARQGGVVLPVITKYLKDKRWYVVRNTAVLLGDIRDPEALEPVTTLLEHEDARVRREAIRSMTKLGGRNALESLIRFAQKGDVELRRQAILSVGAMKDPVAVVSLLRMLRELTASGGDSDIRKEVIKALGEIGAPESVPELIGQLKQRKFWGGGRLEEIRAAAAAALGMIRTPQAIEALQEAAEDKSPLVAREAAKALKQLQRGQ